MSVIVDTNVAASFFHQTDAHASDLWNAIMNGCCCVIYGGKLRKEYEKIEIVRRVVKLLDQAGKARAIPDQPVDEQTNKLTQLGKLASNDAHVIALAQVSDCRLLYSLDVKLHADFTNQAFLAKPRGQVYQGGAEHKHLIRKHR